MKALDFALSAVRLVRWLAVTVVYAVLAPWFLFACFLCLVSFLPHEVWSFRETLTDSAFADSGAWKNGAAAWHVFANVCFAAVCVVRIFRGSAMSVLVRQVNAGITAWIDCHISSIQQKRIGTIVFLCTIAGCVALVVAGAKMDKRPQTSVPPMAPGPHLDALSSAAALRLSTGRIVSGKALITPRARGEFLIHFQDEQ
jgi:hypothetical protein